MIARRQVAIRHWFDRSTFVQGTPEYDVETVAMICTLIVENGLSLKRICEEKLLGPDTPNLSTIYYWRRCDERVSIALDSAREARAEIQWEGMKETIEEIFDALPPNAERGDIMAATAKARLLFDVAKFEVSKLVPRYADKIKSDVAATAKGIEERTVTVQVVEVPEKKRQQPELPPTSNP